MFHETKHATVAWGQPQKMGSHISTLHIHPFNNKIEIEGGRSLESTASILRKTPQMCVLLSFLMSQIPEKGFVSKDLVSRCPKSGTQNNGLLLE